MISSLPDELSDDAFRHSPAQITALVVAALLLGGTLGGLGFVGAEFWGFSQTLSPCAAAGLVDGAPGSGEAAACARRDGALWWSGGGAALSALLSSAALALVSSQRRRRSRGAIL